MSLWLDASALLGLAYACVLAGLALWVWEQRRADRRVAALRVGLAWAAVALLAGYVLAQGLVVRRVLLVNLGDFLIFGALGALLATQVWQQNAGNGQVVPLAVALAALTFPVFWPPSASPASLEQSTALYAIQAAFHALGAGACMAAMPAWYRTSGAIDVWARRERAGLAVLGLGIGLSSAWAWLNWGIFWRSDPRLNLFLAGWLALLAGFHAGRANHLIWARALKTIGIAILLIAALGAEFIARGWEHLAFVAW